MNSPLLDQPPTPAATPQAGHDTHQAHGFNWIDALVVLVTLVSGGFALMRGFVKEAFVLVSWIAATVVTLKLFPLRTPGCRSRFPARGAPASRRD